MRLRSSKLPDHTYRRIHAWRVTSGVIVLVLVLYAVQNIFSNPRFEWDVVGDYFLDPRILDGVVTTLWITAVSMVAGSLLGVVLGACRLSDNPVVASAAVFYLWLFRGTPVLVQLFLWYNIGALYPFLELKVPFGGPTLFSVDANELIVPLTAALLGLSLHLTAYMGEIFRGGIISVDSGQQEAAYAFGLPPGHTMFRIILPQALPAILPAAANQLIALLKYTSLISVLSVTELLYSAQLIYYQNFKVIPLLMVATIWYLTVTTVLSIGQYFLELRLSRSTRGHGGSSHVGRVSEWWRGYRRNSLSPKNPAKAEEL